MKTIRLEREGDAAVVTLARPERRNALSLELMRELTACLEELGADKRARSVILAAEGKVFSSGHDLTELQDRDLESYREIFGACVALMNAVKQVPQPVIAEVQGLATAAGCQLVAACDLAVASMDAAFATPGVKIGLFCTTPMVEVMRAIGRKRAMEMLLTGRMVAAREAAEWGLVNAVATPDELKQETRRLASQIAEASVLTVSIGKRAFYSVADMDQKRAYAFASETMCLNSLAGDAQEGISAFLERRPPRWRGE